MSLRQDIQAYANQTLWPLQPLVSAATPVGKILEATIHLLDQPQYSYAELRTQRNALLEQIERACEALEEQILQAVVDSRAAPLMPIHLFKMARSGGKLYIVWRRPGEKTKGIDAPAIMRSQPLEQRRRWERLNARREQIALTHSVLVYLRTALKHHLDTPATNLHLEVRT